MLIGVGVIDGLAPGDSVAVGDGVPVPVPVSVGSADIDPEIDGEAVADELIDIVADTELEGEVV
jgi:hypothetical protein